LSVIAMQNEAEGFTFHDGLTELYRATLDRERLTIWGASARVRFYIVAAGGYELQVELTEGWQARRWTSIDSDVEGWRLEVEESADLTEELMARVAMVDLIGGHGLSVRCKVHQVDRPVTAGHVWSLKLNPTGEAIT
jgi:hypothetical protein